MTKLKRSYTQSFHEILIRSAHSRVTCGWQGDDCSQPIINEHLSDGDVRPHFLFTPTRHLLAVTCCALVFWYVTTQSAVGPEGEDVDADGVGVFAEHVEEEAKLQRQCQ